MSNELPLSKKRKVEEYEDDSTRETVQSDELRATLNYTEVIKEIFDLSSSLLSDMDRYNRNDFQECLKRIREKCSALLDESDVHILSQDAVVERSVGRETVPGISIDTNALGRSISAIVDEWSNSDARNKETININSGNPRRQPLPIRGARAHRTAALQLVRRWANSSSTTSPDIIAHNLQRPKRLYAPSLPSRPVSQVLGVEEPSSSNAGNGQSYAREQAFYHQDHKTHDETDEDTDSREIDYEDQDESDGDDDE